VAGGEVGSGTVVAENVQQKMQQAPLFGFFSPPLSEISNQTDGVSSRPDLSLPTPVRQTKQTF